MDVRETMIMCIEMAVGISTLYVSLCRGILEMAKANKKEGAMW